MTNQEEISIRYQKNADVLDSTGDAVGTIEKVVVDPDEQDVTHVVMSDRGLPSQDRLIPVGMLATSHADGSVRLESEVRPDHLPSFVDERYAAASVTPALFGPAGFVLTPKPEGTVQADEIVPATDEGDTAPVPLRMSVIDLGTRVIDREDRRIGRVVELVTRSDGSIEGIIAQSGMMWFTRRWLVPLRWIEDLTSEAVRLGATKQQFFEHAERAPRSMAAVEEKRLQR